MKLVATERFETQKDVTDRERSKAKQLLARYESMSAEEARADTTHAHITSIPDTPLKDMSLSADKEGKHAVFGLHGDDVVMLGFIQDSPRIHHRNELFDANSKAIDLMLVDFMKYQQEHKLEKLASPPPNHATRKLRHCLQNLQTGQTVGGCKNTKPSLVVPVAFPLLFSYVDHTVPAVVSARVSAGA